MRRILSRDMLQLGMNPNAIWPAVHLSESGHDARAPGFHVPMRRLHRTLVEYAEGGTWLVHTELGQTMRVPPGHVFVIPAEVPHELSFVARRTGQSRYWLVSLRDAAGSDLLRSWSTAWTLTAARSHALIDSLGRVEPANASNAASVLQAQAAAHEVLTTLVRAAPCPLATPRAVDPRIREVVAYLQARLASKMCRSQLAAIAHLSPTRFHYVFTEAMGISPGQYLLNLRLQRARELLWGTTATIKEIAREAGFSHAGRFSRTFRKKVGVSPLEYRQQFSR